MDNTVDTRKKQCASTCGKTQSVEAVQAEVHELNDAGRNVANATAAAEAESKTARKCCRKKDNVKEVLGDVAEKVLENGEKAGDYIAEKATSLYNKIKNER